MKFYLNGNQFQIYFSTYSINNRLAVGVKDVTGKIVANLSCNIPGVELNPDEFILRTWEEAAIYIQACRHLFIDTKKLCNVNVCPTTPIWRLKKVTPIVVVFLDGEYRGTFWDRDAAKQFGSTLSGRVSYLEDTIQESGK